MRVSLGNGPFIIKFKPGFILSKNEIARELVKNESG